MVTRTWSSSTVFVFCIWEIWDSYCCVHENS